MKTPRLPRGVFLFAIITTMNVTNSLPQLLEMYASANRYLFHGSASAGIQEFEPRQAYSFGKPDGEPAIFAADTVEPAIFMAVLGSKHVGGMGKKDVPGYGFYIQESDWRKAHAEKWQGYVYILPKGNFYERSPGEWLSTAPVKPIAVCGVDIHDLPQDIRVMDDADFMRYIDS